MHTQTRSRRDFGNMVKMILHQFPNQNIDGEKGILVDVLHGR